jgi:DNA polymerase V
MNYSIKTRQSNFTVKQIFRPEQKILRNLPVYHAFKSLTPNPETITEENPAEKIANLAHTSIDESLDLNGYIISHPSETFLVKIAGDTHSSLNVSAGDILVVNQTNENRDGKLVVGNLENKFVIKYLKTKGKQLYFAAETEDQEDIEITPGMKFEMWGVVTYVIHKPGVGK